MNAPAAAYPDSDWSGDLAMTGMGLVTPVGLTAANAIAAMRAGISRLGEIPWFEIEVDEDDFAPLTGAMVAAYPANRHGVARLGQMIAPALREAIDDANLAPRARFEIYLGIADDSPHGRTTSAGRRLQQAILAALPADYRPAKIALMPMGRAAGLAALRAAAQARVAEAVDAVIVGGVDSLISPRTLTTLRRNGMLREFPRRTGVLPGEAAGFAVFETPGKAAARGARAYARVTAASGRTEPLRYGEAGRMSALAGTLQTVCAGWSGDRLLVVSDLNGQRYRALEWGTASISSFPHHEETTHWHPAEYIGDAGAASGVVSMCWAAKAMYQGYARTTHSVVWGASEEGARESMMLQPAAGRH